MTSRSNARYYVVFGALMVLTAVTVLVSTVHLGGMGNVAVALVIAALKASLVALFFMHLKYDGKADKYLYAAALFPLLLFAILACALMPDVAFRMGDAAPPAAAAAAPEAPAHGH